MFHQRAGYPRRVGATRIESLGWAMVAVAAIGLGYLLFYTLPRERALYGDGSASATGVISRKPTDARGKPLDYGIYFQFKDRDGGFHTVKNYYDPSLWQKVEEANFIQVKYVTFDPQYAYDARLLGTRKSGVARVAPPLGLFLVIGAAGLVCVVGTDRLTRRQPRPASAG